MPSYAGSSLHASVQSNVPLTRSMSTEMTSSILPINCPVVSRSLVETRNGADSREQLATSHGVHLPQRHRPVLDRCAPIRDVSSFAGSSSGPYSQAKSSVTPKGVPSSSLRAYRFPIEVFESSTREKMPALRSFDAGRKKNERLRNSPNKCLICG
jgi:hypothetical protein